MKKITFGQRLIILRKHLGFNLTEMANNLGTFKSNLSRYEHDLIKPTIGFMESLIRVYGVNLNWLFDEKADMFLPDVGNKKIKKMSGKDISKTNHMIDELSSVDYTSFGIPVFIDQLSLTSSKNLLPISGFISAGAPMEITPMENDFVQSPIYKTTRDIDDYYVFRVNGLSMSPEIQHEDIVFIYKNDNWIEVNNKIVAIMVQGEVTLKKLIINTESKEVVLVALNKEYDNLVIDFDKLYSTRLIGELKAIKRK